MNLNGYSLGIVVAPGNGNVESLPFTPGTVMNAFENSFGSGDGPIYFTVNGNIVDGGAIV